MAAVADVASSAEAPKRHAGQPEDVESDAASTSTRISQGSSAHGFFSRDEVRPWEPQRFRLVRKIQDAKRNHGEVFLMYDETEQKSVAVKQVPIEWAGESHTDFLQKHPDEPEMIWVDIGCSAFLDVEAFPYLCKPFGVYRDCEVEVGGFLYMVSEFADKGDLFSWCSITSKGLLPPGPEREALVRPITRQIFDGIRRLHDLSIVHGDVSLENILLQSASQDSSSEAAEAPQVKIIDFGRSSFRSRFRRCCVAKPSYKAPEMCTGHAHDGFLADAFAAGVVLYALLTQDYPWLSTEKGADKTFDYYTQHGLRALLARKKSYKGSGPTIGVLSDEAIALLEGLLAADPAERLTLGGGEGLRDRRPSVWESAWWSC